MCVVFLNDHYQEVQLWSHEGFCPSDEQSAGLLFRADVLRSLLLDPPPCKC